VIGSWSVAHASEDNLVARVAELEDVVARLRAALDKQRAELARKDAALIWQKDRIADLEKALEDAGRRQKRQTAPFSKASVLLSSGVLASSSPAEPLLKKNIPIQ